MKTSTGYAETGATLEDLRLMRESQPAVGAGEGGRRRADVRAADGGARIGVTRVGATATKQILDEAKAKLGG